MLALELATTIRHDGHGGLLDLLGTPEGVEEWLVRTEPLVTELLGTPLAQVSPPAGPALAPAVAGPALTDLRVVVRNLFARAVRPASPTRVELAVPLEPSVALRRLNRAAEYLGTPRLTWEDDGDLPTITWAARSTDPLRLLSGAIARSTIDFLTSPDVARLRACPAARCVRYFLQTDPRQTWCSPSCGNRERVSRHYRKQSVDPSSLAE
ncbi:CGNR zinc finger domain-containing protein [Kribbella sp. NPDC051770]|uniref:CGNR zinc finger domain-containing protein n=1 Tax=Kribbella sp. NPDC051770 TaxID=3155413 RepID=UPI00341FD749